MFDEVVYLVRPAAHALNARRRYWHEQFRGACKELDAARREANTLRIDLQRAVLGESKAQAWANDHSLAVAAESAARESEALAEIAQTRGQLEDACSRLDMALVEASEHKREALQLHECLKVSDAEVHRLRIEVCAPEGEVEVWNVY